MKIAILSDVHGNLPALEATLAYIQKKNFDATWFLGDAVGYGPWPGECLELLVKVCDITLIGNHGWLAIGKHPREIYSSKALEMADWTKKTLGSRRLKLLQGLSPVDDLVWDGDTSQFRSMLEKQSSGWDTVTHWLTILYYLRLTGKWDPLVGVTPEKEESAPATPLVQLVHASVLEPVNEYLTLKSKEENLVSNFRALSAGVGFFGHTHVPTHHWLDEDFKVHTEALEGGHPVVFNPIADLRMGVKRLFNPGSVGQPRDGNPKASFAKLQITGDPLDAESRWTFTVGRVTYDIASVVERFEKLNLPLRNGQRLHAGV